jgi:molybdopterin-guanine dinucleotide biosynthesis protein
MNTSSKPTIIGVGGLTSEVGKTTLVCDLLRAFPGWEAIKTTRGHYRSCGKDPSACCVSHLLADEAVIRSGRELTYAPGKDTGRYWDAGAANVHWVIATDSQIAGGIEQALGRVKARGVFVEGNSFTEFIDTDFFIMVARPDELKIKATARRALSRVSAVYLSDEAGSGDVDNSQSVNEFLMKLIGGEVGPWPMFTRRKLPELLSVLHGLNFQAGRLKIETRVNKTGVKQATNSVSAGLI